MGLKLAYFGSGNFSIGCLKAVLKLPRDVISSVDVVTRRIKPSGRNLKIMKELPIARYANDIGINVLRADDKPEIINLLKYNKFDLAVAVSYGNLIPQEFLSGIKYGGINVHPSLLPKYSGSSPIEYALMNDDKFTGVTVQTLHPTKFDRGDILIQSEPVVIEESDYYDSLMTKLTDVSADLLQKTLVEKLYVNKPGFVSPYEFSLAKKIKKPQTQILWNTMTTRQIIRLHDALGRLHTFVNGKRVVLDGFSVADEPNEAPNEVGEFVLDGTIIVKTIDGFISIDNLLIEGYSQQNPMMFFKKFHKRIKGAERVFRTIT